MTYLEEAQALHQELTIVDAHHDIAMDVLDQHKRGKGGVLSEYWGPQLQKGGVNVQVMPTYVENRFLPDAGLREAFQMVEAMLRDTEQDDSRVRTATSVAEIDAALADGRVASVLAIEGCDGLGGDLAMLRLMYRLGVRMVSLTWDRRNAFADGTGEKNPGGLTRAGHDAVKEMMTHKVICDVSHLAEPGFWQVIDLAEGPIVASHSNARAVCDVPRNLTDEQIRAIADTGGVIGINFFGLFVRLKDPTLDHMVDHIEHIIDLVGVDSIGIGPDFLEGRLHDLGVIAIRDAGMDPALLDVWLAGCDSSEQLPAFTAKLLERGFAREDIAKILGENFMRVFRQVWD